ncbi:MAG TPA: FAD-linked oxidase C-terminal domain-containing protein [Thermoanaerobaculia bacterium]|nr:FAD-linked oxidase C-terminal domain-containing protein [Thermoanaerobaculia bacterium]
MPPPLQTAAPRPAAPAGLAWGSSPADHRWRGNARTLERDLAAAVEGEVRFDAAHRAMYAVDASNYRQPPIGVVFPRAAEDVERAVAVCRHHGAPVLGRGGGTSLAGQCVNHAVVFDYSRHMHRVLEVDPARRLARVEPGCVLDALRQRVERDHGLTFSADPATHTHCTLGGMIGNNSCGAHSVMAGRTSDNVHALEVLTYDGLRFSAGAVAEDELARLAGVPGRLGEIHRRLRDLRDRHGDEIRRRYPDIPRRVSGYNLDDLLPERGFHLGRALTGSEGTLVTVLEATLRLVPWPPHQALLVVGYEDAYAAADHVPDLLELSPLALEGMDERLIDDQRKKRMHPEELALLPDGGGWLLVELGGATRDEAVGRAEAAAERLRGRRHVAGARVFAEPAEQLRIWEVRESGLGATARVPGQGDTWEGWEDSAVPPERLGDYLRDLRRLLERFGYRGALYGHFGQGCVHTRNDFDLFSREGVEKYLAYVDQAADLVVSYGGSLSGEHGDGQSRGALLPKMFGDELCGAFREMKAIFDPGNRMNPGKIVDPYPIDSNLRFGESYRAWEPATAFRYVDDDGRFSRAALRCVGVGKCRRETGGTMCPSYRATREEMHSTRGRAHLLHEMLVGEIVADGWRSREVKEALDLCLACKGCKADCPVDVDVATYKAEFLSHYYRRRLRPPAAYSMGLVHEWARIAARAPRLVNLLGRTPGLSHLAKALAGIDRRRELPRFATRTFRRWFERERPAAPRLGRGAAETARADRPRVLFFPDTFSDFLHPDGAIATVRVLEAAGYEVAIPAKRLCCGRPLYDYGFLGRARHRLAEIVDELAPAIDAGVPMVVAEPSCAATFRDELPMMLPDDPRAARLAQQTRTLAEQLADTDGYQPPRRSGRALYHGHCHHKAVMRTGADEELLRAAGLHLDAPVTGCCGLAGSFGFERGHYEVSIACGEQMLLPAVRGTAPDDLVIADGFSCRTQIEATTGRRPLHLAEVLAGRS